MTKLNMFHIIIYFVILVTIATFVEKITRDEIIIKKQNDIINRQQVDNDNLNYQLQQCKILYKGL